MSQNQAVAKGPVPIHSLSGILGIQLGIQAVTGNIPPVDRAAAILTAAAANKTVKLLEFPLDILDTLAAQKSAERTSMALRILETLLHHAGISTDLSQSALDDLVARAWSTVATMEREKSAIELISSASIP